MYATAYADVNELLEALLAQLRAILGNELLGLYLYGSLVTGDFDHAISDIDLLAVTTSDVDERTFAALDGMQNALVVAHPQWTGRVEIAYLSVAALRTFRHQSSRIAVMSPGEPFHFKDAGREWLMNWYIVREQGRTLFGPASQEVIAPISTEEFTCCVREHVRAWPQWIGDTPDRTAQSYGMLTLCRALYALAHGSQASKRQAAAWAARTYPQWAELIDNAMTWRAAAGSVDVDHAATLPQTQRFIQFAVEQADSL